jgi:YggT family protein
MSALHGFVLAAFRDDFAGYVLAVIRVYTLLIIAYILSSMFFQVGGRLPYNRALNAVMTFLRDVCEPYLRIFRRILPPFGPLDLSPMVGIILLNVVGSIVANLIDG